MQLREATSVAHDRLDALLQQSGWSTLDSYTRFLQIQYVARRPIELWARAHCPANLLPPAQSPLIANDLAALGAMLPAAEEAFAMPPEADAIGLAWALAGSSLGNRVILREIEHAGNRGWPLSFLSDQGMTGFWQKLRPQLEQSVGERESWAAGLAALAVFAHFSHCARMSNLELAA
ncbi:biliverdin-producing heme oxygenase [Altererythrobacter arenosus]|uniref:Biliverdin-producing heme oxygenase n=1 Tax=Altererythrobacter arenosus TaxID=3032592 RepID=A0ABY8FTE7_9SPHN|nr:biliverdin-producing heme oxygenase [Altererythrobacter sp. CAU 1644]WFL78255.1 biliverdin-producing heme oxygenase [Altererythrobacter sp. CAU 1644]